MLKTSARRMVVAISMVTLNSTFAMMGADAFAQTLPDARQEIACPQIISRTVTEIEGTTFDCGTVSVPVDYAEPNGKRIELMYGVLRSTSLSPAADPVIYLHGGPGGGELAGMTNALVERLATLRERRDIIVFDQRGSGFSPGEIECNDVFAANRDAMDAAAQAIVQASGMNIGAARSEALIPPCSDHLSKQGVDLSQYNTVNNARDVISLAQALGLSRFNIYGHSYGTRLGLEVLRQKPEGLRAVILDSVLPTDVAWRERLPETNEEAFFSLNDACMEQPSCAKAYPDLSSTLNAVFDSIAEQPMTTPTGLPISTETLERLILFSFNQAGAQWRVRYLPRMIYDLKAGKTQLFEDLYLLAYSNVENAKEPRFALPGISFAARPLLNRANAISLQAQQLEETAESLARQAFDIAREGDESPSATFLRTLAQLEEAPYSSTLDSAYAADRTSLPLQPATRENLTRFIERHFVGADAQILLSLAKGLSAEDIAGAYRQIRNEDRFTNSLQELAFALRLYTCNDSIPFNSAEEAERRIASYRIPGLAMREARTMIYELSHCYGLPTGTLDLAFHDPVTGDGSIPVLVLSGASDPQTATSWAKQAADNLIGSQFVRFPNTGHGVTLFSQCARDIAGAFLDQPHSNVNSNCTEDLIPIFVLPDDPLSK